MLTSIRREIPDNSIAGTKILDGTNVSYVGDFVARLLYVVDMNGSDHYAAGIMHSGATTDNAGLIFAKDEDGNTRVNLDGRSTSFSFIDRIIVFGGNSLIDDQLSYPTQVTGGLSVSGDVKCIAGLRVYSGTDLRAIIDRDNDDNGRFALLNVNGVTRVYLSSEADCYINRKIVFGSNAFPFSTSTYPTQVVGNFGVNGTGYFAGGIINIGQTDTLSLRVNSITMPSSVWQYVNTMNQNVATTSSPTFADMTIGSTLMSTMISSGNAHTAQADAHNLTISTYSGALSSVFMPNNPTLSWSTSAAGYFKYRQFGTTTARLNYMHVKYSAQLTGGAPGVTSTNFLEVACNIPAIFNSTPFDFRKPVLLVKNGTDHEMGYATISSSGSIHIYRFNNVPFLSGETWHVEFEALVPRT